MSWLHVSKLYLDLRLVIGLALKDITVVQLLLLDRA